MKSVACGHDRPPRRASARIDDDHMHRSRRKVGISLRDRQRSVEHVEGLHGMADIDDGRVRDYLQNDTLHGADKVVVGSKIGGQRDDRTMRQIPSQTEGGVPPVISKLICGGNGVKELWSLYICSRNDLLPNEYFFCPSRARRLVRPFVYCLVMSPPLPPPG